MMDFSSALILLKNGRKMRRRNWNASNQFVFYIDPYLNKQYEITEFDKIAGTLAPHLLIKTTDNKLVPWLASQTDLLSQDWETID